MVFKRRNRRGWTRTLIESIYPRGGWKRAILYIKHRVRRLPDTPHKIARGIWAGVFLSATPLFGLHLIGAMLIAWSIRGNIIASVIGTFYGNPLTYVPLVLIALELGNVLLGRPIGHMGPDLIANRFAAAGHDLWTNFLAIFTPQEAHWHGLVVFWQDILWPSIIGGTISGIVQATVCYYLTIPLVRYYQDHRRARLMKRITERKKLAADKAARRGGAAPQAGDQG